MDELKCPGKPLLRCISEFTVVELIVFADQTLEIRKAGHTHSLWEPAEHNDCLTAFFLLAGLDKDPDVIVILGRSSPTAITPNAMLN